MKLLQELKAIEQKLRHHKKIDESKPFIDKICKLLFRREGEYTATTHYGVINKQSTLCDKNGSPMMLSFDNSNAQQEFELNSLTPLGVEKDSDSAKEIERMYREHGVTSKAGLKFVSKNGKMVLRGVNFGKQVDEKVLRMVQDMLVMLLHDFSKKR